MIIAQILHKDLINKSIYRNSSRIYIQTAFDFEASHLSENCLYSLNIAIIFKKIDSSVAYLYKEVAVLNISNAKKGKINY